MLLYSGSSTGKMSEIIVQNIAETSANYWRRMLYTKDRREVGAWKLRRDALTVDVPIVSGATMQLDVCLNGSTESRQDDTVSERPLITMAHV